MSGGLRPGAAPFVPPSSGLDNGTENDSKLAALSSRFPFFPLPSLKEVLEATGGDLASAEMMVESIEGSARAAGAAERQRQEQQQQQQRQQRQQQELPTTTAAAFPPLLGGSGRAAPPPPHQALSLPPLRRQNEAGKAAAAPLLREEDFPALGAAAAAPAKAEQQQKQKQEESEREREENQVRASFATAALCDPLEAEAAARAASAASAARAGAAAAVKFDERRRRPQQQEEQEEELGSKSSVPWVSTGAAVSSEYARARERARALCVARNVAFEQATQAYLRGDKAAAKELGAQGRGFAAEMREEHERAAASIFESRNNAHSPPLPSSSRASPRSDSVITLDLHGLHVAEGVAAVERAIERAREESRGGSGGGRGGAAASARAARATTLKLIVGAGRHTTHGAGRRARLPLAVKSKLDELGVEWEEGRVEGMVAAFV